MIKKKKVGRPATGRVRNKTLSAKFTDEEITEIVGISEFVGKTQADTVLAGVRLLEIKKG